MFVVEHVLGLTGIRLQLATYFGVHRGSLNQNTARSQASLGMDKTPARIPTGALSGATIEETTVSLCVPPVRHECFNYWLDDPINLLCR